jgi:hypothetical protein
MNLDFRSEQALAGARQFQQAQKAQHAQKAQYPERSDAQHPWRSDAQPSPAEVESDEVLVAAASTTSSQAA